LAETQNAFNVPLKCTPEEYKHFVEPAMAEANKSNFAAALEVVSNGLNAHPASEGLLFLKAYFGYKVADNMSNELGSRPRSIRPLENGALMVDGTATTQMLERFEEIGKVLGDADTAIDELLQVNPNSQEVMAFKGYIDMKLQKLAGESRSMRSTFNNSPNIAGGFCAGCKKNISFGSQAFVFRKVSPTQMEVWHFTCYDQKARNAN
jgi:hypothetical protein